jgi:hypothetical protein
VENNNLNYINELSYSKDSILKKLNYYLSQNNLIDIFEIYKLVEVEISKNYNLIFENIINDRIFYENSLKNKNFDFSNIIIFPKNLFFFNKNTFNIKSTYIEEEKDKNDNNIKNIKVIIVFNNIISFLFFLIFELNNFNDKYNLFKNNNFYFFIHFFINDKFEDKHFKIIFGNEDFLQKYLFNNFSELDFVEINKINYDNKNLNYIYEKFNKNLYKKIYELEKSNDNFNKFFPKNYNIINFLEVIKIKNISALSTAYQQDQYIKNFFKNLIYLNKKNHNIKVLPNLKNRDILIFGASPKIEFLFKLVNVFINNLNINLNNNIKNNLIFNKFLTFSVPSSFDILLKNKVNLNYLINFDTNFFVCFHLSKYFKSIKFLYYIKNTKLIGSLFIYPSIIKNYNNDLYLINFKTSLEQIVFNKIDLPTNNFAGTTVNMQLSLLNSLYFSNNHAYNNKINQKLKVFLIGSEYENLGLNNKNTHHKYYPLYNYILKNESYIKTLYTWETKNYIYSSFKHKNYKKDLESKELNNLRIYKISHFDDYENFIKNNLLNFNLNNYNFKNSDLLNHDYSNNTNSYNSNNYFICDSNKLKNIKNFDANIFKKNCLILKENLNKFFDLIINLFDKNYENSEIIKLFYFSNYEDFKREKLNFINENNDFNIDENGFNFLKKIFEEIFFNEIYFFIKGKNIDLKKKINKIRRYLNKLN